MRLVPVILLAACSFEHGSSSTGTPGDGSLDDAATTDAPDGSTAGCPSAYTDAHGASRYREGQGTWYAAQAACEADGTHLAVIDSAAENAFVLSLDSNGDIWIGASDHVTEGMFLWLSGAGLSSTDPSWQASQPNDASGDEDCVEINAGGVWNDNGCQFSQTYVCECDGRTPPLVPTWCRTALDTSCDTCSDDCTIDGRTCSSSQVCET